MGRARRRQLQQQQGLHLRGGARGALQLAPQAVLRGRRRGGLRLVVLRVPNVRAGGGRQLASGGALPGVEELTT
eukprot:8108723-Pyramimonas_sp.AAC.1